MEKGKKIVLEDEKTKSSSSDNVSNQKEQKKDQFNFEEKAISLKDQEASLEQLFKAGVHFGHQKSRWNPAMKDYIFTVRQGVHILDLAKTEENLKKAIKLISSETAKGGQLLFVGTKRQAKELVKKAAEYCRMPYVVERWLGGTLTNFEVIRKRVDKLSLLEDFYQRGELKKYTKKEQAAFKEKIQNFNRKMGGLKTMKKLPAVLFVVDVNFENLAVIEAKKMGIPVVGLVDTNADPKVVDIPIPANDDAVKSLQFILAYLAAKIKKK
jgi:small subunit ribosomal protein S2